MPVANYSPKQAYHTHLALIFAASALLFLVLGCEGTTINPTPDYSIRFVELDSIWILESPDYRKIVVQAVPPELGFRRTIRCLISGNGVSTHFNLYDDGSELERADGQGYCETFSGDAVAGDGKFTRKLNTLFTTSVGTYNLVFAFMDHTPGIDSLYGTIEVAANSPPVVSWFQAPDSVESGASGSPFFVRASDPDGNRDISLVQISRSSAPAGPLPRIFFDLTMERDSIYRLDFQPGLAAGFPSGIHRFFCRANDRAMNVRDQFSYGDTISVWLENGPPKIDTIYAPDTVWVQGGVADPTLFYIGIDLDDDQTYHDLDTLLLTLTRYDTTQQRDIVLLDTIFFDSGRGNDTLTAPDLIRTGWSANRSSRLNTPFTFTWTPTDKSSQRGRSGQNTLVIALMGNNTPGRDSKDNSDPRNMVNPFR